MSSIPRMEQVFFHTHSKISHSILRHSSHRFRSTIEHLVLGLAVCGFCVVLLSHVTFVHRGDFLRGAVFDDECNMQQYQHLQSRVDASCEVRSGMSVYSILIQIVWSGYTWIKGSESRSSLNDSSGSSSSVKSSFLSKKQIPMNCLKSIPGFNEDADVTHILLYMDRNETLQNGIGSRAFTVHSGRMQYNELILTGMPVSMDQLVDANTQQLFICSIIDADTNTDRIQRRKERRGSSTPKCPIYISSLLLKHGFLPIQKQNTTRREHDELRTIYSYSHAEGLLLLSPELKQAHNVSTQFVIASSSDVNCFGEPFVQNMVFSLVGADTVILNWILGLQQHLTADNGFDKSVRRVYHWKTGKELDLDLFDMDHYAFSSFSRGEKYGLDYLSRYPILQYYSDKMHKHPLYRLVRFLSFKLTVFLSTLFIFFLTTSLVSFTFQETQDRMLEFTLQLQTYVRARLPLRGLVVKHILESLVFVPVMVGMIFFLIEFYEGDKFLAFMVLSMVWIAEVFSAISIRSIQGMHFFPRVFFLYFTLFHVYFFSCPIGFTYASLASTLLFLVHTMLFFLNRYELPTLNAGLVSPEMPRMIRMQSSTVGAGPPSPHIRQPTLRPLPQFPDLSSRGNHESTRHTINTEPLSSSTTHLSGQRHFLPQNPMANFAAVASTSLQSIRSLASMQSLQSLADRASPNWLYTGAVAGSEEDDDSYMQYVGDGTRSSLSMSIENR